MKFPATNKIHRDLNQSFGENAKLLEEYINTTNWKVIARFYFICLGVLLVTLFSIIVTVELAVHIF